MKVRVLALLSLWLTGCSAVAIQPGGELGGLPAGDYEKRLDLTHGDYRLVVFSMPGIDVSLGACNTIRGPTLLAKVINLRSGAEVASFGGGSEADPDVIIDFSQAREGIYRFTDCTHDPREGNQVPFIVRTVKVRADGSGAAKEEIVLKPEAGDQARLDELVQKAIQESASKAGEETVDPAEGAMAHIRNIGIGNPDAALAAFAKLRGKVGTAGSEILGNLVDEINRVKELKTVGAGAMH